METNMSTEVARREVDNCPDDCPSAIAVIVFMVIALLLGLAAPDPVQGQLRGPIRNLTADTTPAAGDMLLVDKASPLVSRKLTLGTLATYIASLSSTVPSSRLIICTPPLLCAGTTSMDLSADHTLSLAGPNITTINIACTGGATHDTNAKDAALVTLQAGTGGIIHFSGSCALSSAIVNDPASGVTTPLIVEGDSRRLTSLSFSVCATDCILLASESAMGAGATDGSGIRDLIIGGPSNKNLIHLKGLQGAFVDNVYTSSGDISLIVEESRFGMIRNSYFLSPTTTAIKIIGETFSSQWFDTIEISTSGSAGSAVNYTKTGTTDAGGAYFHNVVINGQWGGSGFLFSATTQHSMFVNCGVCYADGNFAQDAFRIVKAGVVNLAQSYGTNQYAASNASALTLDNAINVHVDGGTYYTDTGASGPAVSLKNTTTFTTISPSTHLWSIGYVAVKVDGTTHDVDLSPSFYSASGGTFTNDATKLVPSSSVRYRSPWTLYTGTTKPSMFGMLSPAGSLAQYTAVDSSGVRKQYADNGTTVLETLSQAGAAVFTSTITASNFSGTHSGTSSGTNTGDQVVPANTTATTSQWFNAYNSSTGAFTKTQPAFTDLPGSAACSQLPALTGAVTTSAGSCATSVATTTLASGSFSPTITGVSNVDSASAAECRYDRVLDRVHFTCRLVVDNTTASTFTRVGISLPIASNLSNAGDLVCTGGMDTGSTVLPSFAKSDSTNHRADWFSYPTTTDARSHYIECSYLID